MQILTAQSALQFNREAFQTWHVQERDFAHIYFAEKLTLQDLPETQAERMQITTLKCPCFSSWQRNISKSPDAHRSDENVLNN